MRRIHALLIAVAFIAAVGWPLATYVLTLAVFGVPHVLAEMRYVDARLGPRFDRVLAWAVGGGVLAIGGVRGLTLLGWLDVEMARVIELGLGIGLALVVMPGKSWRGRVVAVACGTALALGLGWSPPHALLAIAVLHNLTPLLFVAERSGRGRSLSRAGGLFIAVPLLIATGLPYLALHPLGLVHPEWAPLVEAGLDTHMRAYLPSSAIGTSWALHAFSACAFGQCMHYLYVIDVLPRRLSTVPARWPQRWWVVLVAASAVSVMAFAVVGFTKARGGYGVLAAMHAWLELPALVLVLMAAGGGRPAPRAARATSCTGRLGGCG